MLTACGGEKKQTPAQEATPTPDAWCIAVLPTMDCLPLYVAAERGFFEQAGVPVFLRAYQAQMDIDTALQQHRVVGAATDLARVEHLGSEGLSLTCVTATAADWQLVSKRTARMSKLTQLDDKMLAMTRYSATDLLADLVVDSAKLKDERVFRIQVNDIAVRLSMLQSDIMDAMFLPEPQATTARNQKGRVMLDTRQLDIRLGTIAFITDSLKGKEDKLKAFLAAYDQAVDSLNELGIRNYNDLMKRCLQLTQQTIDSLPENYQFRHSAKPREKDVERARTWWNKRVESMKYVEKRYIQ